MKTNFDLELETPTQQPPAQTGSNENIATPPAITTGATISLAPVFDIIDTSTPTFAIPVPVEPVPVVADLPGGVNVPPDYYNGGIKVIPDTPNETVKPPEVLEIPTTPIKEVVNGIKNTTNNNTFKIVAAVIILIVLGATNK